MNNASPSFGALGVRTPLVQALQRAGITEPFPIQADTLPDSLAGRDVLGRGSTGSGKTLAFAIPMVDRLADSGRAVPNRPAGLILAPTRELATQIAAALEPLVSAFRMTVTTVFGGVSQHRQVQALRRGVDIVVACPGRLEDLMKQGLIALDAVEITVIDEADHMADLGFLPAVTRILAATPEDGQRLLFSATLDNGVDKLVKRFLSRAVRHSVDNANSPVDAMTHHVFEAVDATAKRDLVHALASGTGRRILFTRTKHQARKLAKQLTAAGIPAVDLHGNLAQNARDRNLAAFASGSSKVLVATDVAARGVHVDGVELVVHVDPPAEHKAYLHRSGRTARAGNSGDVVTLVLPEQRRDLAALMRQADIAVTPQRVPADSPAVTRLVGEVAPLVTAVAPEPAGRSAGGARKNSVAGQGRTGEARDSGGGSGGRRRAGRETVVSEGTGRGSGGRGVAAGGTGRGGSAGRGGTAENAGRGTGGANGGRRGTADSLGRGNAGRGHADGAGSHNGARGNATRATGTGSGRGGAGRGGAAQSAGHGSTGRGSAAAGSASRGEAGRGADTGGRKSGAAGRNSGGHGIVPAGRTGGVAGFSRAGAGRRGR
ncbi:DEAD/DEAH box helicase [Nocardia sp. alder85J]|uniref:DEAD/DEAH box helicase n=1 Tax=Nocardia sp. alder85J TaxID=2862949 RepID=UPI001CD231EA|nr:DEAD/DEAH box helicase [Nocardia sp. alder85J]MCX4092336.1 DEAD/DEAH box helicase [Nocardia sp. alder85J]